jgi:hypothetical protein
VKRAQPRKKKHTQCKRSSAKKTTQEKHNQGKKNTIRKNRAQALFIYFSSNPKNYLYLPSQ